MDKELLKSFIVLAWLGRQVAIKYHLYNEVDVLSKRAMVLIQKEIYDKLLEEKDE